MLEQLMQVAAGGATAGGGFYGVRWVVMYLTGRADQRQAKLDREHDALDMSWKDYRLNLETRFKQLERQNRALRMAFEHVAGALVRKDPDNPALAIADRIMASTFPDDFSTTVARLDGVSRED